MSEPLKSTLGGMREMMLSADIDYALLAEQTIDRVWMADYNHQRIVNSFLFNYLKIQDRIGSKLFRLALQQWRENDLDDMTMLDILNRLEKLGIIESVEAWDKLRELRNALAHEYPEDTKLRIENIQLALQGYLQLKAIVAKLEQKLP
jgi:hypothetical protein